MFDEHNDAGQVRDENIETMRDELRTALASAKSAVYDAVRKVDELSSAGVYDIEYAEGTAGPDMVRHLDTASAAIRATEALNPGKVGANQR